MKNWAQSIIIAVIVVTIIEMILPNNKNKKYISTVISVYILFTIISPIISKISGKSVNIEDYINTNMQTNIASLENNTQIENLYLQTLKTDITNKLKENGYTINSIDFKTNINSEILEIELKIDRNEISNIEIVEIDISKEQNKKTMLSDEEIEKIKRILVQTYGIEKDKIHIN